MVVLSWMLVGGLSAFAADAPQELPWALRDHFTFGAEDAEFLYDAKNAEWGIRTAGGVDILDHVGFEIVLGDGTVLSAPNLGEAEINRTTFSRGDGKGTLIETVFPVTSGLEVRHAIAAYREAPFVEIRLAVKNVGEAAVDVAALRSAVMGPGDMLVRDTATTCTLWTAQVHGAWVVYGKQGPALLSILQDPAAPLCLVLGMLPGGVAVSGGTFSASGGVWQGDVTSTFAPSIELAPGSQVEADPIWVSHGTADPAHAVRCYAWALRALPGMEATVDPPRCWVTTPDGAGASELRAVAQAWAETPVRHALVPTGWEGAPGTCQGLSPHYPKNIGEVVDLLRNVGLTPGITIDPLLAPGGNRTDVSALSVDGRRWHDPSKDEARDEVAKRVAILLAKGFAFLAVQPSDIPDEVLRHFHLTRAQADALGLCAVAKAAGDVPVMPVAGDAVRATADDWLRAAACTTALGACGVKVGPVRLEVGGVENVAAELKTALRFASGTIELVGEPSKAMREGVQRALGGRSLRVSPLDAASAPPRLWFVRDAFRSNEERMWGTVVMMPGAPAWSAEQVPFSEEGPVCLWRPEDGRFIEESEVPGTASFNVVGLFMPSDRPSLMGASADEDLLLSQVDKLRWSDVGDEAALSGSFCGRHADDATAYVAVPAGWVFRSGKVGDKTIPAKEVTDRVAFPVPAGGATPFELRFKRQ